MWPKRENRRQEIVDGIRRHSATVRVLPGIAAPTALEVLATQFVASERREDYYRLVQAKPISVDRASPNHLRFDAERAVAYYMQKGNPEEAAWLVFLMTHFARPRDSGWLRLRDVYGRLGAGIWDWKTVSANPGAFIDWLEANSQAVRGTFGNHRKYESLSPRAKRSFRRVVTDYFEWIGGAGHAKFFADATRAAGNDPGVIFDALYKDMKVLSFGRLAKFDYLALIGRYGIAPIHAGSAYFDGATGPTSGAKLLFDGDRESGTSNHQLQQYVDALDNDINVGMQVMEDPLCNWQKSPDLFVHFKG
jgi:Alpha-glutamyl/putrescinyl thymine pyrophosphorylase clade 3